TRQLVDAATVTLVQLPWGGKTAAFGTDDEPIHLIAHYLSNRWLQTTHIIQQLEILRLDIKCAGIIDCELLTPHTFDVLTQMYQTREVSPYRRDGFGMRKNIWGLGEELLSGQRKVIAGISNINNNHWVGIVVDMVGLTVKYGDSLGGTGSVEVIESVAWWLHCHIPGLLLKYDLLPITKQEDTFSCGVLAINAIRHAVLP
ncbi:hypothetical protein BJ912DRAFT_807590, partial [Pholiota molesta]